MLESTRTRLKSLAKIGLVISLLIGVAWAVAYAPVIFPQAGRSVQAFVTVDSQHPEKTTLMLNVGEGLPLFQDYRDQRMTCAGVRLPYGQAPYQTLNGYYGTVPSAKPGQAIHCTFRDWQGTVALDLATSTCVPPSPLLTSPGVGSPVSVSTNLQVTYMTHDDVHSACGEQSFFPWQARDLHGHYAPFHSGGIGPAVTPSSGLESRGYANFFPPDWRDVAKGPGSLYFESHGFGVGSAQPGWHDINYVYKWSAAFPVTWV